jgi:hypothetical protein
MRLHKAQPQAVPTIRDLYPSLSDEQLKEAEENLKLYLEACLRVYERVCADPKEYERFKALTEAARLSRIKPKGRIIRKHNKHS